MSEDKKQPGINIELSEEIAEGIYSNLAIITHSASEFILDYIRIMPGVPKGKVKSRIVMTPEHAKKLYRALSDNLSKYENCCNRNRICRLGYRSLLCRNG